MKTLKENNLEDQIKDIILDVYKSIYIGIIKIEERDDGFILILQTNKDDLTSTYKMYVQCKSEEEFLDYIREDFLNRNIHLVKYYTGEKIDLNDYKKRKRE